MHYNPKFAIVLRMRRHGREPFSLKLFLARFFPMFLISALLPILFFGVQTQTSLFSRADNPNSIRIWIEPSTVIAKQGQSISLDVMAELDKPQSLLPSLSLEIHSTGITIENPTVNYVKPFGGKIVLQTLSVIPENTGQYQLSISKESIQTGGIHVDAITTGGATILVK